MKLLKIIALYIATIQATDLNDDDRYGLEYHSQLSGCEFNGGCGSSKVQNNVGGAPFIQLNNIANQKTETGGVIGCFGINGVGAARIKEILKITPGVGVFFYTADNCVRATRINDGQPPQTAPGAVAPQVSGTDVRSLRLVLANGGGGGTPPPPPPPGGNVPGANVQFTLQNNQKIETGGNIGCFGVNGIGANRIREITRLSPGVAVFYYTADNCVRATRINEGNPQTAVGPVEGRVAQADVRSIRLIVAPGGAQPFQSLDLQNYQANVGGAPFIQLNNIANQKTETGGVIGCFGINGVGAARIKEILKITPGVGVFFYTADNCVRATRINDGQPPQTAPGAVAPQVSGADVRSLRLVLANGGGGGTPPPPPPPGGNVPGANVQFTLQNNQKIETGGNIGCFGVNGIGANRIREITRLSPGVAVFYYTADNCVRATRINEGNPQTAVGPVEGRVAQADVRSIRLIVAPGGAQPFQSLDLQNYQANVGGAPFIQLRNTYGNTVETGGNIGCFGVNGISPTRLKEILKITPGVGVFFYTAENCVRATRINDGQPPQTFAGPVASQVSDTDVRSLRLVKA